MQTIELNISGMTCGACVHHATKALQSVSGAQNVVVDLAGAKATVAGESIDLTQLISAVEEEGYGASESAGQTRTATIPLSAQDCSCCG